MKRKLIKQGGSGLTFYIPKKWADEHKLEGGDEIDVQKVGDNLLVSPTERKAIPKEITLKVTKSHELEARALILNAYRAGYDKITIEGSNAKELQKICDTLIGFEMFKYKNYVLESVSEPSYENFENIVHKQFFMILEILKNIEDLEVKDNIAQVQRYEYFLKRALMKKVMTSEAAPFLWQFFTNLNHVARQCTHLVNVLKPTKGTRLFMEKLENLFRILQKGYLTMNINVMADLREEGNKLVYKSFKVLSKEDSKVSSYLISIARLIYISNSPLTGVIQLSNA